LASLTILERNAAEVKGWLKQAYEAAG